MSGTPDALLDLAAERARLAKAQAEMRKIGSAVARGELVPRRAVQQAVASGIDRVRSKLLALCTEIAPRLIGAKQPEVEAMLMDAVREALQELEPADDPPNDPQPAA